MPSPSAGAPNPRAAHLHFLDLHFLLKEVAHSKEQLASACTSALEQLADSPDARALVSKIGSAQRDHIIRLEQLIA